MAVQKKKLYRQGASFLMTLICEILFFIAVFTNKVVISCKFLSSNYLNINKNEQLI